MLSHTRSSPTIQILSTLPIGTRFRMGAKRGKIVGLTPGAAVVEIIEKRTREFVTRSGRKVTIGTNRQRMTWSLATRVEVEL